MFDARFVLTGDRELERRLRRLPEKIQTKVMRGALTRVGARVRKLMRDKISEDHEDTGTLRKSIGTRLKNYKTSGNTVLVVGPRKTFVAANGERADKYAIGIERGWRGRDPDPFAKRAYEMAKPFLISDWQAAIGKRIEKEAAKV